MCGIAGLYDVTAQTPGEELARVAGAMAQSLTHRGPDESGVWVCAERGLGLGHRRLSIVDLSPAGSQPMHSPCGRFTIVYNGEVYNHQELRRELEACGHRFRGRSDTEVLLAAASQWGLRTALERASGMFALAVWDHQQEKLLLARDRLGIKPLYWCWLGDTFVFASELKALHCYPGFCAAMDRSAVALFLQHSYIPAPLSIYCGVNKLQPGCVLEVSGQSPRIARIEPYWSFREVVIRGQSEPFRGTEEGAVDKLEELLHQAVGLQKLADVPVGAFLSGGIDSSTVVALMQAQSTGPVRTFTIGFEEPAYDEARFAAEVARRLNVDHTVLYVSAEEARQVIPRLPGLYDEPFADVSQIPTFLVSQLARQHVKVSLSGDGGDELFAGYDRYDRLNRIWRRIGWMPAAIRRQAAGAYQQAVHRGLLGRSGWSFRARALGASSRRELYDKLHRHWDAPGDVVIGSDREKIACFWAKHWIDCPTFVEEMMALDTTTYLPDCILTKLDRASMAVSLEARVPLLDHHVVEFAWTLPARFKFRPGRGKIPLRRILQRRLPPELFERPKRGFGLPIGQWLRGPLRSWAEELVAEERLKQEGFLQPQPIVEKWREHVAGRRNWQYLLWDVLMFQAWLEHHSAGCRKDG